VNRVYVTKLATYDKNRKAKPNSQHNTSHVNTSQFTNIWCQYTSVWPDYKEYVQIHCVWLWVEVD